MPVIIEIDLAKCTGCGDCVTKCPTQAVELVEGSPVLARPDDCDYCTECEVFCTAGAISCPFEIVLAETEIHGKFEELMPAIIALSATSILNMYG